MRVLLTKLKSVLGTDEMNDTSSSTIPVESNDLQQPQEQSVGGENTVNDSNKESSDVGAHFPLQFTVEADADGRFLLSKDIRQNIDTDTTLIEAQSHYQMLIEVLDSDKADFMGFYSLARDSTTGHPTRG